MVHRATILVLICLLVSCGTSKTNQVQITCYFALEDTNSNMILDEVNMPLNNDPTQFITSIQWKEFHINVTLIKEGLTFSGKGHQLMLSISFGSANQQLISQTYIVLPKHEFNNIYEDNFTGITWIPHPVMSNRVLSYSCSSKRQ